MTLSRERTVVMIRQRSKTKPPAHRDPAAAKRAHTGSAAIDKGSLLHLALEVR